MNKIYLLISGMFLLLSCKSEIAQESSKSEPNFIFILADDQRYNTIQALGNPQIITPTLDSLASVSTYFNNAYLMGAMDGAVCAPSRAMLMTSRNLFQVDPAGTKIDAAHHTLPEILANNGYQTFHTGKWHNGEAAFTRSFTDGARIFFGGMSDHYQVPLQEFDSSGNYAEKDIFHLDKHSTEIYTDAAITFLEEEAGAPFFLYLAYQAPHDPKQVPEKYIRMYNPDSITLPPNFLPRHPFDNGELNIRDEWLAELPRQEEDIKKHIAAYYAMITHIDAELGRLFQQLKKSGEAENTYVIFSADNGLALGQHGLMGKQNLYEHSIKVPLLISGPGIPENVSQQTPCYLTDIFPTILDIANQQAPEAITGQSLLPVINSEQDTLRHDMIFAYKNCQRAIRSDDWKMITYNVDGNYPVQLFNLKNDPWEMNNLAENDEYQQLVSDMKERLSDQLIAMGDSAKIFQENWGVEDYLSWEEDLRMNKPQVLEKLRKMAEEENQRVLNYYQ